mmetsp:Transcript_5691/g.12622  ORF Transcript_5691/g.12622 Transcript_5691/m.12622 type:complete len:84 (-) Transcript_5691:52-303(-)
MNHGRHQIYNRKFHRMVSQWRGIDYWITIEPRFKAQLKKKKETYPSAQVITRFGMLHTILETHVLSTPNSNRNNENFYDMIIK